jgi:DNA anti-recombination protein RmuC
LINIADRSNNATSDCLNEFITPLVDSSALEMSRNFRSSYAEWIAKMFDSQVSNMKLKLEAQFQEELKRVRDEKNREIAELHDGYERKLMGWRATSEKLEAQLKRAARDFIQMNETKSRQIKELKALIEVEQRRSAERPTVSESFAIIQLF